MTDLERAADVLVASLAAETDALNAGDYAMAMQAGPDKLRALKVFVEARGDTPIPGSERLLQSVSAAASANRDALATALSIQTRLVAIVARTALAAGESGSYAPPSANASAAPTAFCIET